MQEVAGPPTIDHLIGQERAVQQLRVALAAHYNDRMAGDLRALPHVLIVGPAGVGKSVMAGIIGRELGVDVHEELAQNITSPATLHSFLLMIEPYGCAFLDEIHELPPMAMTTLYRSLEERRLFLGRDRPPILLPEMTFCAATTEEWALPKSLRDRFKIILRMTHYTDAELAQVIAQRAKQLFWPITNDAVKEIARRGRNTPRLAIRLLDAARTTARSVDADTITQQHVEKMLLVNGIDGLGLDVTERRYLELLHEAKIAVRQNVLGMRLGLPRKTIEMVESDLIRMNLITKSDAGRMLTDKGTAHLTGSTT